MRFPVMAYEVTRTADGKGGYTEAYVDGKSVWVDGPVPGDELKFKVDAAEVVNQGDVIEVASTSFR